LVFSLLKIKRALVLMLVFGAGSALGATQDDQLRVDPTMPLGMVFNAGDAESVAGADGESGIFDIFGDISGAFTNYELSSVLVRAGDRIAVINEERVRVGDKVGSAVVASIDVDQVILDVDGEPLTLKLYESSIKTPVKGDE
jgi:hypothetical protein